MTCHLSSEICFFSSWMFEKYESLGSESLVNETDQPGFKVSLEIFSIDRPTIVDPTQESFRSKLTDKFSVRLVFLDGKDMTFDSKFLFNLRTEFDDTLFFSVTSVEVFILETESVKVV